MLNVGDTLFVLVIQRLEVLLTDIAFLLDAEYVCDFFILSILTKFKLKFLLTLMV